MKNNYGETQMAAKTSGKCKCSKITSFVMKQDIRNGDSKGNSEDVSKGNKGQD